MPYKANTTFFVGRTRVVEGDIVDDDDPVLAGRAKLFDPVDPYGQPFAELGASEPALPVDDDDDGLRERARELGIKRVGNKSHDRLAAEVAEAEAAQGTDDPDEPTDDNTDDAEGEGPEADEEA